MRELAYAKINWTLEVLGVRPDGYHDLRSIVLTLPLHDEIAVQPSTAPGITVTGCPDIPQEQNLVYKAAQALARRAGREVAAVAISVVKRIPQGAGLGGGSADAAATLRLLNRHWALDLSEAELVALAAEVGSDVPALVLGGAVMMEGRGERVRRLTDAERAGLPRPEQIELLVPPVFASTPLVYREFRERDRGRGVNDLEPAAVRLYPPIAAALSVLRSQGLSHVAMSGSGSAVYGVKDGSVEK